MEENLHSREKAILSHPKTMSPTDLARFVLLPGFKRDWKKLGLTQFDLDALQVAIMANPIGAPVIKGTGGLRKLRFAPRRWRVGKSGGARVCYVYFDRYSVIVLMAAYKKSEKDNLSMSEINAIKGAILRMESALERDTEEEGLNKGDCCRDGEKENN